MKPDVYENPLISRYCSPFMAQKFSASTRIKTWRLLWIVLADSQRRLGLHISKKQIQEMEENYTNIDFEEAKKLEKIYRHDVMAHVHLFGRLCPKAKPIIHLGATSSYVTDNADLLIIRDAIIDIRYKLVRVIDKLASFAYEHREMPTLGFTHLQPAQPTTVGKRASLWAYDLMLDLKQLEFQLDNLDFRGVVGTTGTQASFLKLFNGDHEKVKNLNKLVTKAMAFDRSIPVCGQTYTRKVDTLIINALAGIAESAHKIAVDIRLLANRKEIEEPFGKDQIGSSAMAYKRNPMRCERICSLARYLMSQQSGASQTHANQWMERTLDDSAIRRLIIPNSFLAADSILILLNNVVSGLVVYDKMISKNLAEELPFMATEDLLMEAVAKGGDRQDLHEAIRKHSKAAANDVKLRGKSNSLIDRLKLDPLFDEIDIDVLMNANNFVGRAPQQVEEFMEEVQPIRDIYKKMLERVDTKEELRN